MKKSAVAVSVAGALMWPATVACADFIKAPSPAKSVLGDAMMRHICKRIEKKCQDTWARLEQ